MCTFAAAKARCSAVGSVPGLGPGCRRFESCHLDIELFNWPLTYNKFAAFFVQCPQKPIENNPLSQNKDYKKQKSLR